MQDNRSPFIWIAPDGVLTTAQLGLDLAAASDHNFWCLRAVFLVRR